jgi:hypothetical protein
MSTMIASDANNPNFTGAHNPDAGLAVMFYPKAVQNNFLSEKEGRPIFDDVDFVKIKPPGDPTLEIDRPAREDDKKRFPQHWAHYKNKREGDQRLVGKTPLSAWPLLTPAQGENLRALKFIAVEDIANASDLQLQSLGMAAGMSPHALREHAQRFLNVASAVSKESAAEARVKELEERLAALEKPADTKKKDKAPA